MLPDPSPPDPFPPDLAAHAGLLPRIEACVREAGEIALEFFREGAPTHAQIDYKHGGSPVTEADLRIDAFLSARLQTLAPGFGWLSEETADSDARLSAGALFVVDPIDGTRGFAAGDPCFAICVALVIDAAPVFGVVHAPALGETYVAVAGGGATRNGAPLSVSPRASLEGARLAAPQHYHDLLKSAGVNYVRQPRLPSLAMRIVSVAAGDFDAAFARENAFDWDIAAADLVLREAGGVLTDFAGRRPLYNQALPKHPSLAAGPPALHARLLEITRAEDARASARNH